MTTGTDKDCQLHSIALLSNLTCDSIELRTEIAASGIVRHLLDFMPKAETKILVNITWFLANFMAGKGLTHSRDSILRISKAFKNTIYHESDDIVDYSCWGLRHICHEKENIDLVIELGCCPKLIDLMFHFSKEVSIAAINAVGEIIKGDEHHIQAALDSGVLMQIKETLKQGDEIKGLALWLVSNIAAGSPGQIKELIESGLLADAVKLLNTGDEQMKYEIAWIVLNMLNTSRVNQTQIEHAISLGWIQAISLLLASKNGKILTLALKALRAILNLENIEYINQLGYYGGKVKLTPSLHVNLNQLSL